MDIGMHKHLSVPGLLEGVKDSFSYFKDPLKKSAKKFDLVDCLMSGMAIFGMKYPSLLQFDEDQSVREIRHNLRTLYGVKKAPCDTQLRTRLDEIDPESFARSYKALLRPIQRSGVLRSFESIEGYYPVAYDATGYFSSHEVHCENCCIKNHSNGSKTYYHQMLSAVLVHPDKKEVLPLICEPIIQQEDATKNDCEINAAKRMYPTLRTMHPNLKMLVLGDGLYANGPHIKSLLSMNYGYLIVAKPDNHKALFEWVSQGRTHLEIKKEGVTYHV